MGAMMGGDGGGDGRLVVKGGMMVGDWREGGRKE
jgi:hypothetical protein